MGRWDSWGRGERSGGHAFLGYGTGKGCGLGLWGLEDKRYHPPLSGNASLPEFGLVPFLACVCCNAEIDCYEY